MHARNSICIHLLATIQTNKTSDPFHPFFDRGERNETKRIHTYIHTSAHTIPSSTYISTYRTSTDRRLYIFIPFRFVPTAAAARGVVTSVREGWMNEWIGMEWIGLDTDTISQRNPTLPVRKKFDQRNETNKRRVPSIHASIIIHSFIPRD